MMLRVNRTYDRIRYAPKGDWGSQAVVEGGVTLGGGVSTKEPQLYVGFVILGQNFYKYEF